MDLRIAALLPSETAAVVHEIPANENFFADSWPSLVRHIEMSNPDLAIVDPTVAGRVAVKPVLSLLKQHPSLPVAAYCRLSNQNFIPLVQLVSAGLADVFLYPFLHDPDHLQDMLTRMATDRVAYSLLALLETRIVLLNPSLQLAIFDLFRRPQRYSSGADIARQCQMSVRELYRALLSAGLSTPKRLVTLAKALRGYAYLRDAGATIEHVSRSLGYCNRRQFSSHLSEVFGCSVSALRTEEQTEVITSALDWMYRPTERFDPPPVRAGQTVQ